jgi:ariadne-1
MGQQQAKEYLAEYWADRNKPVDKKKDEARTRKLFNYYDTEKAGFLTRQQGINYLNDLMMVSGVKTRVISETPSGSTPEQHYERFLSETYTSLDKNNDGKLQLNELLKPDNAIMPFVTEISTRINRSTVRSNLIRSDNMTRNDNDLPLPLPPGVTPPPSAAKDPAAPTLQPPVAKPPTPVPTPSPVLERRATSGPCLGGCGFAGHAANEGYCSTCYAKHRKDSSAASKPPATRTEDTKGKGHAHDAPAVAKPPAPTSQEPAKEEHVHWHGPGADPHLESMADDDSEDDRPGTGWKDSGNWLLDEPNEEDEKLFTIMTKTDIEQMQLKAVESVAPQLGLTLAEAALVLRTFDWATDKLLARYFDKPQEYLQAAGVFQGTALPRPDKPTIDCQVCFDTIDVKDVPSLACGHALFCRDCWRGYLHDRAETGAATLNTKCMSKGCPVMATGEDWSRLAAPKDLERYHFFYMKSFVNSNRKIAFCPNPRCSNAVSYSGFGTPMDVVECTCGARYCFACGLENHNPVTCALVVRWRELNSNDQESIALVKATSKQCPHCGMATERNEGCNHMTCRKEVGGCGGEWCWMCRGDWKTHGSHTGGFYSCNKYDKSPAKKLDDDAAKTRAEAERFAHFFDRYAGHEANGRDAQNKREAMVHKSIEFAKQYNADPKVVIDALDLLINCRHVLKYTYVYGYFVASTLPATLKELFEYQQANSEGITERLAHALMADVSVMKPDELKNLVRVTGKYMENMTDSFEDMENQLAGLDAATIAQLNKKVGGPSKTYCTFARWGKTFTAQPYWECRTCGFTTNQGVCEPCKDTCHKGHTLGPRVESTGFYCDCGSGSKPTKPCKNMPKPAAVKAAAKTAKK